MDCTGFWKKLIGTSLTWLRPFLEISYKQPIKEHNNMESKAIFRSLTPLLTPLLKCRSVCVDWLVIALLLINIAPPTLGNLLCNQTGKGERVRWRTEARDFYVTWSVANVCSSSQECYGYDNGFVDVQLCPLFIQEGDRLFLEPSNTPQFYLLRPTIVSIDDWNNCPHNESSVERLFIDEGSQDTIEVPLQYLRPGTVYLAQYPNGLFSNCQFGLRLVVHVKPYACTAGQCGDGGTCAATIEDAAYTLCDCDKGYTGVDCSEYDACAQGETAPCENAGVCVDEMEGTEGTQYTCQCRDGYTGRLLL